MLHFLCQLHHLPRRLKDGFIPLLMQELDVELSAREPTLHKSRLPLWLVLVHGQSKSTIDSIATDRIDATSARILCSVPIFNALWFGTVIVCTGGLECLILT